MGSKKNKVGKVICPLTKSNNIQVVSTFEVHKIVELYKQQISIDVSRYFKGLTEISLLKCNDSGYLFYWPLSIVGDDRFYEELSSTRINYYSERWEHNEVLQFLSKEDKILEIGSGFGAFIKLLQTNKIYNVKGLELNAVAVDKCKLDKINVEEKLIEEEAKSNTDYYDVVCYFQVLEHITNVYEFIESSLKTLKKGGKLIIGVPNNNPFIFVLDKWHTLNLPPHHAGLWNKKSLKSLEDLFPIKLVKLEYEPLEYTYDYFYKVQIENTTDLKKIIIKVFNKIAPKLLKWVFCNFVNGRNVLAVYIKK
jgi:SAM-dependent methyltransferase